MADGDTDSTSFNFNETICNFANSSICEDTATEDALSNAQVLEIYDKYHTQLIFSLASYYNSTPFTQESWVIYYFAK